MPVTFSHVNRFSKFFRWQTNGKFATNSYLNISPHLKYVTTLPCEIWMTENCRQSEICRPIVINDKSQDSTTKHLSCNGLFQYKFITQLADKRIFKIGELLAKLQAKWLIVSHAPFAVDFCSQTCRTLQISWIPCAWRAETVTIDYYVNTQINVSLLSTNIKLQ